MQLVGQIVLDFKTTEDELKPENIYIDAIGIGAGVASRLRELGLPVVSVNVAECPAVRNEYYRLRDELWFKARSWFLERDCKIPESEAELASELCTPRYEERAVDGLLRVESKKEMKRRGVNKSTDLADSFCLTFATGRARGWGRPLEYPNMGVV